MSGGRSISYQNKMIAPTARPYPAAALCQRRSLTSTSLRCAANAFRQRAAEAFHMPLHQALRLRLDNLDRESSDSRLLSQHGPHCCCPTRCMTVAKVPQQASPTMKHKVIRRRSWGHSVLESERASQSLEVKCCAHAISVSIAPLHSRLAGLRHD